MMANLNIAKIIEKKILPEYFDLILSGKKKFELRLADFDVKDGDFLLLREWDKNKNEYTGREIKVTVTYTIKTKDINFWSKVDVEKYGYQIIQFDS